MDSFSWDIVEGPPNPLQFQAISFIGSFGPIQGWLPPRVHYTVYSDHPGPSVRFSLLSGDACWYSLTFFVPLFKLCRYKFSLLASVLSPVVPFCTRFTVFHFSLFFLFTPELSPWSIYIRFWFTNPKHFLFSLSEPACSVHVIPLETCMPSWLAWLI